MKIRIVKLFTKNWVYKVASVFIGFTVWVLVQSQETLEVNTRLKVFLRVPDNYVIEGDNLRYKDITIRGPRAALTDISSRRSLEAIVNIPTDTLGPQNIIVSKETIRNFDTRLQVYIHDPYITINLDEKGSKKVAVKENLKGLPADGFFIEKVVIKPEQVSITGLKGSLSKIPELITETIDVTGLNQTKSFDIGLLADHQYFQEINPEKVNLTVFIAEKKINKRFSSVPIEIITGERIASVKPSFISIVVQGTPNVLANAKPSEIKAFLDTRELLPGKHSKTVQVKIPLETTLIEINPSEVTVEVR